MKKFIKSVLVTFLVFSVILALAVFIFITFIGPGYFKPQIIAASEKALGRPVSFNNITLNMSLRNGIQLYLSDVSVAEHPDFGSGNFLTAKGIDLSVSAKDFILKRKIHVLKALIESPVLAVTRLKDGRINVHSFIKSDRQKAASETGRKTTEEPLPILVNSIRVSNGRLVYTDYLFEPVIVLKFQKIQLKASDVSLSEFFPLSVRAAFASDTPNLALNGKGNIDLAKGSFLLTEAIADCDLSSVSLEDLRQSVPQLQKLPPLEIKSGKITANINLFEASSAGLLALNTEAVLKEGLVNFKNISSLIEAKLNATNFDIRLSEAVFDIGGSKVKIEAKLDDYLKNQAFDFSLNIDSLNIANLIDQTTSEIKINGLFSGKLNLKGQGFSPNTFLANLKGGGELAVKEGSISNINILKMVLDKIVFAPGLSQLLEENLPEIFKEKLTKKDTIVTDCDISLAIAESLVTIPTMTLTGEGFTFNGNGSVDFDKRYNFDGKFTIPQDLSLKMVSVVEQLRLLLDSSQTIQFPLVVSGQGTSVSFVPDLTSIATEAIEGVANEQLNKVLENIFDKGSSKTDEATSAQEAAQKQEQKKVQPLADILNTIIKKKGDEKNER